MKAQLDRIESMLVRYPPCYESEEDNTYVLPMMLWVLALVLLAALFFTVYGH